MNEPSQETPLISEENQQTVPWGQIETHSPLLNVLWRTFKGQINHLVAIKLKNGLRYAEIRDQENKQSFDAQELGPAEELEEGYSKIPYSRTAEAIRNTDLGNGYILKGMIAAGENGDKHVMLTSQVEKTVNHDLAKHHLWYEADPQNRYLSATYQYRDCQCDTVVYMRTEYDEAKGEFGPKATCHIQDIYQEGDIHEQTDFYFDEKGALVEIRIEGAGRLNMFFRKKQYPDPGPGQPQPVVTLEGKKLKSLLAQGQICSFLQAQRADPDQPLILNTAATLNNLLQNLDSKDPQDPIKALVFEEQPQVSRPKPKIFSRRFR